MTRLGLLLVCSLAFMLSEVTAAPAPVPSFFDFEVANNMTIDEILTRQNQGLKGMSPQDEEDGLILTELDMLVTPQEYQALYGEEPSEKRVKRKAYTGAPLWTNAQMVYSIADNFSPKDRYFIQKAMTDIELYTCVSFREKANSDRNYVYIRNGKGCSSRLGMVGGHQIMNLQKPGCRFRGLYIHEILHALGIVHEHQRPDRDNYLNIYTQNVAESLLRSFKTYSTRTVDTMGTEYDFASVMHYGTKAFSKNGRITLYPKDASKAKFITPSFRNGLGYTDVKTLNLMYECASHCPNQDKCTEDGHLDQNCNCICKDGSQDCDTTKTPETDRTCRNSHYNSWACHRWAAERECFANSGWMIPNCERACGKCGNTDDPLQGACKDVYEADRCGTWKARGECAANPELMYRTCRKTCNMCEGINARRPENSCSNRYNDDKACDRWASRGECEINPRWMSYNCPRSCLIC